MRNECAVLISGCLIGASELIDEFGGDSQALAYKAGIPPYAFDDPQLFIQAGRILDYFELAAIACNRPDFGLLHARRMPLAMLGPGWMIMRAAQSIGEALLDFVKLYSLYTDAASLTARRCDSGLWLESTFLPVGRYGAEQAVYLTLGCIALFVRENVRRRWKPLRVDLMQRPSDPAPFIEFFGPTIRFGADRNALLIDLATQDHALGAGGERRIVHEALVSHLTTHAAPVVAHVSCLLRSLLPHGGCSIEAVSDALRITPRTLQRRLEAAGVCYRTLVDEARAELAWRHVQRSGLSLGRVAELLGFSNPTAFSRAFRRWYNMSPRAARNTHGPPPT